MANAALGYINLAEAGTISASSQELQMPALKLLTPDVEDRFRSQANVVAIVLDLLSLSTFDTILLRGLTVTAAATTRVRLSSVDASGAAGDVWDSGALVSGSQCFDADYGALCMALTAPLQARYVRFDIADPGKTYVEAGRLAVMLRETFTVNFAYGWQVQWVDRSVRQESRGGQTLIWRDNKYRVLTLNFEWVSPEQRYGLIERVDRINGLHADVLMLPDPDSTKLARDSFYGLMAELTPAVQSVFQHFSKLYTIKERL